MLSGCAGAYRDSMQDVKGGDYVCLIKVYSTQWSLSKNTVRNKLFVSTAFYGGEEGCKIGIWPELWDIKKIEECIKCIKEVN